MSKIDYGKLNNDIIIPFFLIMSTNDIDNDVSIISTIEYLMNKEY